MFLTNFKTNIKSTAIASTFLAKRNQVKKFSSLNDLISVSRFVQILNR